MILGILRHILTGRHLAAFVTVLAVISAVTFGAWHTENPAGHAGMYDIVAEAGSTFDNDAGKSSNSEKAAQDCAFHCDQHGRGLPSLMTALAIALPEAPKLLVLRDNMAAMAQPDGLLEPPRA